MRYLLLPCHSDDDYLDPPSMAILPLDLDIVNYLSKVVRSASQYLDEHEGYKIEFHKEHVVFVNDEVYKLIDDPDEVERIEDELSVNHYAVIEANLDIDTLELAVEEVVLAMDNCTLCVYTGERMNWIAWFGGTSYQIFTSGVDLADLPEYIRMELPHETD